MFNDAELNVLDKLSIIAEKNNYIPPEIYSRYNVKRGLRNEDGTGVLVGLTDIGEVHGYIIDDAERLPAEGRLMYRGIDIKNIVNGFQEEGRSGFEEVSYLLLFGTLPNEKELADFNRLLGSSRKLPVGFTENMILKNPSKDIMNKLQRSILVSYSYDSNPDDTSIKNVLRQSIELIARFPTIISYGYHAKQHYYANKSLFIHAPRPDLGTAENILHMIRPDNKYTRTEAELLDLAMVLHAEHGGGNNSAFATYVVTSTGTDTYSSITAAVAALKGPKHGGANFRVMNMIENIKHNISDWEDKDELKHYLLKMLNKEVFDKSGLIYGIGHAIYTLSDPRALLLKEKALKLAQEKSRLEEFNLYKNVEEMAIRAFAEYKETDAAVSANVDFYSGFVYDMLNIPKELYTPIFAAARISGWCAHRIEQLVSEQRIIRPAYKCVAKATPYIPLNNRG